jgi:uncharacterized protein (UPF0335 family)
MANGPISSEDLRLGIERIERLEEEKKGIADDVKDVYSEYKSKGFCTKTMKRIVALRKLKPDDRRELEAMLDLYKGALGMLDGTPLGRWALEKLEKEDDETPAPDGGEAEGTAQEPDASEEPAEPAEPTIEDARELGKSAAREGKPVTSNPFPARDLRRAAWDEAWCAELGSDGMDIPDALKPAPKAKKGSTAPAEPPASEGDDAAGAEGDA